MNLKTNYFSVLDRIHQACHSAQREAAQVRLLAVSKTKPVEAVQACYELGQRAFGENYLQDALVKIQALQSLPDIQWHFIGPLQSNKTRTVAEHFHWLETLDREKIAQRLNDQRPESMDNLQVLIQVNISREEQKSGILPEELSTFAQFVSELPKLTFRGLMCIPESTGDQPVLQAQLEEMQQLWMAMKQAHTSVDTLSMGMSNDLELAITCGSTEVRIGTDIFGAR